MVQNLPWFPVCSHPLAAILHLNVCPLGLDWPIRLRQVGSSSFDDKHNAYHCQHLPCCVSLNSRGSLCRTKFPWDWIARKRKSTGTSILSGFQDTSPSSWTATGAGPG